MTHSLTKVSQFYNPNSILICQSNFLKMIHIGQQYYGNLIDLTELSLFKKVQVGKDQEKAQSEKDLIQMSQEYRSKDARIVYVTISITTSITDFSCFYLRIEIQILAFTG